jgi:RsiW-degrading membrane proteinase PrsW (M82 family)
MAKPIQTENITATQMKSIAEVVANRVVIKELSKESRAIRQDFILVFGLFASVLIFLSVEVQVFKDASRFPFLVGVSLFILGSLQMFILSLNNLFNKKADFQKDYLKNPVFWIILSCYAGAIISFWIGKY